MQGVAACWSKVGNAGVKKVHGDGKCTHSSVLSCVFTSRHCFCYVGSGGAPKERKPCKQHRRGVLDVDSLSNRDFAIMIARMGFAHGRSIARVDVHGVHPVKRLMHGVGCITLIVKRNPVVCATSACIAMLPGAPVLQ